ncbi:MAG: hypothetical protein KKH92_03790 [Firmicutes bacterium]|nr:hypothetical protein [Bacillota bacterium]
MKYNDLNKITLFNQFLFLFLFQIFISFLLNIFIGYFTIDTNKLMIFRFLSISLILVNLNSMLILILQATNRMKEYSKILIFDRVTFALLIIIFYFFNYHEFKFLMYADIAGKIIGLLMGIYYCKEIIFNKITKFRIDIGETYKNFSVGISLMIANVASMLIIGAVRFITEMSWGIDVFGKISFSLSVTNLIMIFINTMGIVIFPLLKRTTNTNQIVIYRSLKNILSIVSLALLLLYYPLFYILSIWLPQYTESLKYMILVIPVIIYQAKIGLLINPFYKSLRKEKTLLYINVFVLLITIALALFSAFILKNVYVTILIIPSALFIKSLLTEIILQNTFKEKFYMDTILETIMVVTFVYFTWYFYNIIPIIIYLSAYIIFLIIKRKDFKKTYFELSELLR